MPRILPSLPDPTDVVAQGSYLSAAPPINAGGVPVLAGLPNSEQAPGVPFDPSMSEIIEESGLPETFWPNPPSNARLRSSANGAPMQNAVICTPTGAMIETLTAPRATLGAPYMSATRWQIIGTTRDSTGAALPSCRVVVIAQGYLAVGAQGNAVLAELISSAADGTFTVAVPGNGNYGIIAYKPGGAPTVAGGTTFALTMTSPG